MAISFKKYVDITSGVGGGNAVRTRDLILRAFTTNALIPTGGFAEFDTADDVLSLFGSTSEEHKRAAAYFGWISKNITKPQKIAFARWPDVATKPQIFGAVKSQVVSEWAAINNGSFAISLGGVNLSLTGIDFTGVTTLSGVAAILQTKVRTGTGSVFTAATVVYNATRKSFDFEGGATGDSAIVITEGVAGTPIAAKIGWTSGAIISDGSAAQTVTDTLAASAELSNNFASFLFLPDLSLSEATEAAMWNDTQNVMYMHCQRVAADDAADWYDALSEFSGTGLILDPAVSGEYPDQVPATILAATDYSKRNSTQNFMFQQFNLTPAVTDTVTSNTYDSLRVNYYGRTQTAGQFVDFFQRGVMTGLATDPVDMNTYANEIWLKDASGAAIMTLLMSLAKLSANAKGRAQLISTLQSVIDKALNNGTISVGKPLDNVRKLYIGNLTGDDKAWVQVQNLGYWLDCNVESYVTQDSRTEWKAVYTLIYSKDDQIRSVDGTHVLI